MVIRIDFRAGIFPPFGGPPKSPFWSAFHSIICLLGGNEQQKSIFIFKYENWLQLTGLFFSVLFDALRNQQAAPRKT